MAPCSTGRTLWLLAEMRDCQPPGQGEALLISSFSSSISSVKMLARLRAARRLSLLLYEYGGSTDLRVVVSPADPHTWGCRGRHGYPNNDEGGYPTCHSQMISQQLLRVGIGLVCESAETAHAAQEPCINMMCLRPESIDLSMQRGHEIRWAAECKCVICPSVGQV